MLLEVILALILGTLAGIITGLLPGIHINLVIALLLGTSIASSSLAFPVVAFIIALTFTHIVLDFIPTTLLGVPTEDNFLAVQPAHKLVRKGKAHEAIRIAFIGVSYSIPLMILLSPFYAFALQSIFKFVETYLPYLLLGMALYLILNEKRFIKALFIFLLSGILGFLAFNLPVREPLLPLLSGLFGLSSLFTGIFEESAVPPQRISAAKIGQKQFLKPTIANLFISPLLSFFPGIGAGHISLFSAEIIKPSSAQFIFLNSMASSLNMVLSIIAAYSIGKTRTGTSAAIESILSPISLGEIFSILILCIIAIIIACFVGKVMAMPLINMYNKFSYKKIALWTTLFVVLVNLAASNSLGIIVLSASTAIGLLAQRMQIRKIQLMGSLLLPTLMYYLIL